MNIFTLVLFYIRVRGANKIICVFRVTGLNILGRVGTALLFIFFLYRNIEIYLSKCIKYYTFQKALNKFLGFTLNTHICFLAKFLQHIFVFSTSLYIYDIVSPDI